MKWQAMFFLNTKYTKVTKENRTTGMLFSFLRVLGVLCGNAFELGDSHERK